MAIWSRYRDDWTIGNPHDVHDQTNQSGSPYSRCMALAAYMHYNEIENLPMEFLIWKQETASSLKKTRYRGVISTRWVRA